MERGREGGSWSNLNQGIEYSPPDSGGEAEPKAKRGGSKAVTRRYGNHPSRDPLRDPAALLTQEGSLPPDFNNQQTYFVAVARVNITPDPDDIVS